MTSDLKPSPPPSTPPWPDLENLEYYVSPTAHAGGDLRWQERYYLHPGDFAPNVEKRYGKIDHSSKEKRGYRYQFTHSTSAFTREHYVLIQPDTSPALVYDF